VSQSWISNLFPLRLLQRSRKAILLSAALSIAAIASVDWHFEENISFGFLYLFPMLMVGSCLSRLQIVACAALCTGLTEAFDPFPWSATVGISRLVLTFVAFTGSGLYGFATAMSRRLAEQHFAEMEKEATLRRRAEEQMASLISSSPASILTLDGTGNIQLANESAHRLLGVEQNQLLGRPIAQFIPALASVPPSQEAPFFHTEMECHARRSEGEVFLAHIWFSTYHTMSGPRLAALVFDASEELRDRAEFNLQQVLSGSKVLVGAMCHEIRNICGAIGVIYAKVTRDGHMPVNEDLSALGSLVQGLETMAGLELRQTARPMAESVNLQSVLEELRIVIESSFQDSDIVVEWKNVEWENPHCLPRVWANSPMLLQAFLNIAKNSQRALEQAAEKRFTVGTSIAPHAVIVRFYDSGAGVADPESLFAPFQPGAKATGLGLYLSRTFVRAFQGDIEYEPQATGCCFRVILALAADQQRRIAPYAEAVSS
jgi:two-component system, LuxR family, sensor kinase FixL